MCRACCNALVRVCETYHGIGYCAVARPLTFTVLPKGDWARAIGRPKATVCDESHDKHTWDLCSEPDTSKMEVRADRSTRRDPLFVGHEEGAESFQCILRIDRIRALRIATNCLIQVLSCTDMVLQMEMRQAV